MCAAAPAATSRETMAAVDLPGIPPQTYLSRPETDLARRLAMMQLGNGLFSADHHEDALVVQEANLSMRRRIGASAQSILTVQGDLANTYQNLGRLDEALSMRRDVYSGRLKLDGEQDERTLMEANNYAVLLNQLERFEEAKSMLRKTIPVARRVLGDSNDVTLKMRWVYAEALYEDPNATLDDLREAATTLEDTERIARRVFGGAHPLTMGIECDLQRSRAALRARETPPAGDK